MLVRELKLPPPLYHYREIAADRFPHYTLFKQHRKLPESATLAEAGVQTGDVLQLFPNVTLGRPPIGDLITLANGRPFVETLIVVAVQFETISTAVLIRRKMPVDQLVDHIAWEISRNDAHRPQVRERFSKMCESAGWIPFEGQLFESGPYDDSKKRPTLSNITTGVVIPTDANAIVEDFLQAGDCLLFEFQESSDTITIDLDEREPNLLDSIRIYPDIEK
jgi:hypothetical protein